jgi:hypothetical protein
MTTVTESSPSTGLDGDGGTGVWGSNRDRKSRNMRDSWEAAYVAKQERYGPWKYRSQGFWFLFFKLLGALQTLLS